MSEKQYVVFLVLGVALVGLAVLYSSLSVSSFSPSITGFDVADISDSSNIVLSLRYIEPKPTYPTETLGGSYLKLEYTFTNNGNAPSRYYAMVSQGSQYDPTRVFAVKIGNTIILDNSRSGQAYPNGYAHVITVIQPGQSNSFDFTSPLQLSNIPELVAAWNQRANPANVQSLISVPVTYTFDSWQTTKTAALSLEYPRCFDFDGHLPIVERKYAASFVLFEGNQKRDTCYSTGAHAEQEFSNAVKEYGCNQGVWTSQENTCGEGKYCVQGACIQPVCVDSDSNAPMPVSVTNPNTYTTKGTVSIKNAGKSSAVVYSESDACSSSTRLQEKYCNGVNKKIEMQEVDCTIVTNSPNARCVQGKCVVNPKPSGSVPSGASSSSGVPSSSSSSGTTSSTPCTDSDGGVYPNVYGVTTGKTSATSSLTTKTDLCNTITKVMDWYCNPAGYMANQIIACQVGQTCTAGACIESSSSGSSTTSSSTSCTDTDNGANLVLQGTTTGIYGTSTTPGTFVDVCITSGPSNGKLKEYICSAANNHVYIQLIPCPTGKVCSNGACV